MRDWVDRLGPLCAGAGAVLALASQLAFATYAALDYDESYNLQIPLNLYHHGRYQTWYDAPLPFPPQITTGPTVLLPIAGAFVVTGPSYRTARGVMTLFLLVCLWQAYALARQLAGRAGPLAFAAGALLFTLAPNAPWMASVALGELPGVCLLLVAVRLMSGAVAGVRPRLAFAAGVALGLAVLAKLVALICAAGALAALPLAAELRGRRGRALALGATAATGMALPLIGWEVIKLAKLGWAGYADHTQRFWKLMQFGGSGLGPGGLAEAPSVAQHVAVLARSLQGPAWQIWVGLALALTVTLWVLARRARPYALWALSLGAVAYWTWWLRFSTWLSVRHLFSGYALAALLLPVVAALAARDPDVRRGVRAGQVAALVLAALCLFPPRWPLGALNGIELGNQETVARAAQVIHARDPLSVFWGFGWQQAPEISFLAQIPFRDVTLHAPSPDEHNYFVATASSLFGPALYEYAQANCETVVVHEGWSSLCRLRADAPMGYGRTFHP